jgi:hypothetical protein
LQRTVNADVASLHDQPVAETVDNARRPPSGAPALKFSADGSQWAVVTHAHVTYIWDLRAIREQLAKMVLDWALPPYPASQTLLAPGRAARFGLSGTNGR